MDEIIQLVAQLIRERDEARARVAELERSNLLENEEGWCHSCACSYCYRKQQEYEEEW